MDSSTKARILALLAASPDSGSSVILGMAGILDERKAAQIVSECEEMARYRNWLSREEAVAVVSGFVNLDGSKGPHWKDAETMFASVETLGVPPDNAPCWNRWAWFATMNMIWSDEWGVLSSRIGQSEEARVCAELTKARLNDPDGGFNVRRYFRLDL